MPRIALLRGGVVAAVFSAGLAASLALTPQAQSRPADCIIGDVCVTTPLPTVPLPPLPLPTDTTSTTPTTAPPTQSTPPTTATTPAPTPPSPAAPAPNARPTAALTNVRVSVTGKGAHRVLSLTVTLARPSKLSLHVGLRPHAIRGAYTLGAGRHVRKVQIPARTRPGRYQLTLTARDSENGVQTHRRTVSVRR